jgi:hypothetical protein
MEQVTRFRGSFLVATGSRAATTERPATWFELGLQ